MPGMCNKVWNSTAKKIFWSQFPFDSYENRALGVMFVVAGENPQPTAFSDSPDILAVQHEECSAPFDITAYINFFFFFFKFSLAGGSQLDLIDRLFYLCRQILQSNTNGKWRCWIGHLKHK